MRNEQPKIPGLGEPTLEDRVLKLELEVSILRLNKVMKGQGNYCRDCSWWELLEEDAEVGGHGSCHHPTGEAQHIAHTGKPAPEGLAMEGAGRACPLFERRNMAEKKVIRQRQLDNGWVEVVAGEVMVLSLDRRCRIRLRRGGKAEETLVTDLPVVINPGDTYKVELLNSS